MSSSVFEKIKPALYKCKNHDGYWVYLPELALICGWTPEDLLHIYGPMVTEVCTKDGDWQYEDLVCLDKDGVLITTRHSDISTMHNTEIYLPSRYSDSILSVLQSQNTTLNNG